MYILMNHATDECQGLFKQKYIVLEVHVLWWMNSKLQNPKTFNTVAYALTTSIPRSLYYFTLKSLDTSQSKENYSINRNASQRSIFNLLSAELWVFSNYTKYILQSQAGAQLITPTNASPCIPLYN